MIYDVYLKGGQLITVEDERNLQEMRKELIDGYIDRVSVVFNTVGIKKPKCAIRITDIAAIMEVIPQENIDPFDPPPQ